MRKIFFLVVIAVGVYLFFLIRGSDNGNKFSVDQVVFIQDGLPGTNVNF